MNNTPKKEDGKTFAEHKLDYENSENGYPSQSSSFMYAYNTAETLGEWLWILEGTSFLRAFRDAELLKLIKEKDGTPSERQEAYDLMHEGAPEKKKALEFIKKEYGEILVE